MEPTGYHKLIVYQKAKQMALFTYKVTNSYPSQEQHGIISQMRRATTSVPANIVEGYTKSTRDFLRFLDISLGSLAELEFFFEFSRDLGYIDDKIHTESQDRCLELNKLLRSFQKSLRAKL